LPLSPEIETLVYAAYLDVAQIKSMLMKALGIKEH
jgi:hypothetical protein